MTRKPKCVITDRLHGPCLNCGKKMEPAHIGEDDLLGISTILCSECCGCGKEKQC